MQEKIVKTTIETVIIYILVIILSTGSPKVQSQITTNGNMTVNMWRNEDWLIDA